MKRRLSTQRKFFLRRAGIFFAIMMIPSLLVFLFSGAVAVKRVEREINQQGNATVRAVETNCQLSIANIFVQNDLLLGTTRTSMALQHTLLNKQTSYVDALVLAGLRSTLRSVMNAYGYVDSIYLFLDGGTRFFDCHPGVADLSAASDTSWLEIYRDMGEEEDKRVCLRRGAHDRWVLTFIKRTAMMKGCSVVNVSIDNLRKMMLTLLTRPSETITLLNSDWEILLQASNASEPPPDQAHFDALRISESQTDVWTNVEGHRYCHSMGSFDDMIVFSSVDSTLMAQRVGSAISPFGGMLLLNVIVVLVLAYITTNRSFVQIDYMIDAFDRAENGEYVHRAEQRVHDEYDVVMNNIIYMFLKQNHLRNQLHAEQLEKEHSELVALQLQINPHFLYNTLQTLEMEIRSGHGSPADRGDLVRRLSEILRYALSDPHEPVSFEEELQYLRKYAAVQAYRFGDRFVLYYDADGMENVQVFRLMLQPIVENSLLHGMNGLQTRMYIWVRAEREGDNIRFIVSDTGVGMSEQQVEQLLNTIHDKRSRSIGLTNLNRRLLLRYGKESELRIQSTPGEGTEISFMIPYQMIPLEE